MIMAGPADFKTDHPGMFDQRLQAKIISYGGENNLNQAIELIVCFQNEMIP